ncbi:MAG: sigma-70 family RNA polymerase sigma factor [Planctomycetota bacterium]
MTENSKDFDDDSRGVATELLIRLSEGDESAAEPLFERYRGMLEAIARPKLKNSGVRDKDEFDAAQSVLWLYLKATRNGQMQEVNDHKSFENVILAMLRNKLSDYFKHEFRQKRGQGNVTNISSLSSEHKVDAVDYRQTEQYVRSSINDILSSISSERARTIATLLMQGYTRKQAAEELDVTERTVYRELDGARIDLEEFIQGT